MGKAVRGAAWVLGPVVVAGIVLAISYAIAGWLNADNGAKRIIVSDAGWTQAVGAVIAIVAGFAGVLFQVHRQRADALEQQNEAGRAAHLLAFDALDTVSERLNAALLDDHDKKSHRLRGERTNEMVAAMRQFEISRIPPVMLADFIRLRSRVYAINARITELYTAEGKRTEGWERQELEVQRHNLLASAVEVRREAVGLYEGLENKARKLGGTRQRLSSQLAIQNYQRR